MSFVIEKEKRLPIILHVDVAVVGGGPAGIAAALLSARNGAKTVLIERYGYLGGMITAGLCPTFMGVDRRVIGGTFTEILDTLHSKGAISDESFFTQFDPEVFKFFVQDLMERNSVELLLHTWVSDVIVEDGVVEGVIVESKSGRKAVRARVVVDASGDADVAAKAGVPFSSGGAPEQTLTLLFRIGGVDKNTLVSSGNNILETAIHPPSPPNPNIYKIPKDIVSEARARGELFLSHEDITLIFLPLPGVVLINAGHVSANGTSVEDLTKAELQSRKQAWSIFNFLKKNVPGFESAFMLDTAAMIGVRESRRIVGEYLLTKEDIMAGRKFEDAIAQNIMPIDIHGPGEEHTWIPLKKPYDIPYRCLLPKKVENLLVAGRCISTDHFAQASVRSMPCCFATGDAAGVAAALSVKNGLSPRKIDLNLLRETLLKHGAKIA